MDNNIQLAKYYVDWATQVIVIYPNVWKHYPYGNWFITNNLGGNHAPLYPQT